MIKFIAAFFIILTSVEVFALPEKVEVWFLKEPSFGFNKIAGPQFALSEYEENCVPMGNGCFHPQIGFIEKNPLDIAAKTTVYDVKNENDRSVVKTFNSGETDKIECDKNYNFDVFCGKEKSTKKNQESSIEVWVDISSSFRLIDQGFKGERCYRESFVRQIFDKCKREEVTINVFDTGKKEIDEFDTLCISHGLNDEKRLLKWIENSNAKKLFIITDISEFTSSLSDYLISIGAELKGVDAKGIFAKDLPELATHVSSLCK